MLTETSRRRLAVTAAVKPSAIRACPARRHLLWVSFSLPPTSQPTTASHLAQCGGLRPVRGAKGCGSVPADQDVRTLAGHGLVEGRNRGRLKRSEARAGIGDFPLEFGQRAALRHSRSVVEATGFVRCTLPNAAAEPDQVHVNLVGSREIFVVAEHRFLADELALD